MVELDEVLEMAKQLDDDELLELLPKRGVGRPKLKDRLEVMSIPLSKEVIRTIQKLASERGIRPGAMGRELILLGLGALNGSGTRTT